MTAPDGASAAALLQIRNLVVEFPAAAGGVVHAVSDVSLDIVAGETVGLVGESGCGKSTLGRAILQVPRPTSGSVRFAGLELTALSGEALRRVRPRIQLVFQDPISALNPRRRVVDIVAEPLDLWRDGTRVSRRERVAEVLDAVGLDVATVGGRRPREFSGGQCQRIGIARALVMRPELLICDEPVSALDVSVQAQILTVLEEAKARYGLTMLFVGHDLAVVKNVSDRIAVMYLGKLCEVAPAAAVFSSPLHPYTRALSDAVPEPRAVSGQEAGRPVLHGELPSPVNPPSGCRFRTRCPRATDLCASTEPPLRELAPGRHVACHHPLPVGPAAGAQVMTGAAS